MALAASVADNLARLRHQIEEACRKAGRPLDSVRLLAVSKTFPVESILQARECGQVHFGENYVQEARAKALTISGVEWHLIGPLQRNKINATLEFARYIHSIDSVRLLQGVAERARARRIPPKVFLQVRLGDEDSKHGFDPEEVLPALRSLPADFNLEIVGLMTIPPPVDDGEQNRPHFVRLRQLGEAILSEGFHFFRECQLSMGMSDDFQVAIEEGASWVRVGRAIFGTR